MTATILQQHLPDPLQGFERGSLTLRNAAGSKMSIDQRSLALIQRVFMSMQDTDPDFSGQTTLHDFTMVLARRGVEEVKIEAQIDVYDGFTRVSLTLSGADDFISNAAFCYDFRTR